ncbi:phenylalanyl-tRNA synthetase subunit beta [Desulfobulbus sp. Tol-SR]|nr:phenylalanyl-tRNA synthetase subunit beta [Desulfobulbus sp. Tol-SR]
MKFTLDWLNQYVDTEGHTADQLADYLTMLGLEVDAVTPLHQELAPLKTARIISAQPHPDADKLTLCEVAVGDDILQIVCGAPNARAGLNTVIALPGTTLPGEVKIKKSKVRGVESCGMLCSERELALSDSHTGIMELPEGTAHGRSFITAMGLEDTMIEVDLTPNRPDCASVIGIAREIAGKLQRPLRLPVEGARVDHASRSFSVDVESPELCPRYAARLVTGVKIGPSPLWLRNRLTSIGLRPINNVVDITNFVMMEYGQPLHAFDFDNLKGGKIIVRSPKAGETKFTTLDGVERELNPEMLLICDGERPVAMAGVMGGMNSEVTDDTTTVLLESACFNPVSIRKTARRLGLASDASYRFERGVDPEGVCNAMNRAVQLLCDLAGGTAEDAGQDMYMGRLPLKSLTLRVSRSNALLGIDLHAATIATLLQSIGFRCKHKDADTLWVRPPTFRVDIDREADLIEEVARLHGYGNIPVTLPQVSLSYPEQDQGRIKRTTIARLLTGIGFSEAINYSFSNGKYLDLLHLAEGDDRRRTVRLLNPLSEEQGVMRTSLLPGLLENVDRNIRFQMTEVKLFELGKVFTSTGATTQPIERNRLAGVLCGNRHGYASPLHFKEEKVDFLDAKGAVEFILGQMRLNLPAGPTSIGFDLPGADDREPFVVPGETLQLRLGETILGSVGRIRPEILRGFDIKLDVYYFDLDFDALCGLVAAPKSFTALPVYPAVKRDIALVVPGSVAAGDLVNAIRTSRDALIEDVAIFDVYQGKTIQNGYKSVAISVTYRSSAKTLTEKNVEKSNKKIVDLLTEQFGASLRDA